MYILSIKLQFILCFYVLALLWCVLVWKRIKIAERSVG